MLNWGSIICVLEEFLKSRFHRDFEIGFVNIFEEIENGICCVKYWLCNLWLYIMASCVIHSPKPKMAVLKIYVNQECF